MMWLKQRRAIACFAGILGISLAFSPPCIQSRVKHDHTVSLWHRGGSIISSKSDPFDIDSDDGQNPEASTTTVVRTNPSRRRRRNVARVEKFARLPVWPVWNGVFIFVISKLLGDEVGAKLEDRIGGRVCPNFFQDADQTSPFIMLVHHRHSFAAWDILRYIQRTFFPEGFPSHPHRGFVTVTYILKGGFSHRDSLGIKQLYGAEERHGGKHTQWLTTGAGMLHEEMFDMGSEQFFQPSDQELYQIWLNLPARDKLAPPKIDLLGGPEDTPSVITTDDKGKSTETIVIAGQHGGKSSRAPLKSDLAILHVRMDAGAVWKHQLPVSHETAVVYMRRGSVQIEKTRLPPHHTAYLASQGTELTVVADDNNDDGADFLLLAGEPLRERVAASGSMVMNYPDEINEAYADYQTGKMGFPWSEKLTDEQWEDHVRKFPSRYRL